MNDNLKKAGYIVAGALLGFTGAGLQEPTLEDATQVWRPVGDIENKFYMAEFNGEMRVVGFETKDDANLGKDPQRFYEEKLQETLIAQENEDVI